MTLIEISDVSKNFGEVRALDSVSLSIADNEFFSLLGPSGCGKTTLLRILAGFETPDQGTVVLDGSDLAGVRPNHRPVNMMFQSYALFPHMTVAKNIAYGLEAEGLGSVEVSGRVNEALTTVGLAGLANRKPHQLSGGQSQRVALARAIVKRPKVLLLDEPLGALDRKVRSEMQLELKRLQHEVGITFVVVTHDQEEAMSMADRIAVMHDGRVLQVASPVNLYERPQSHFVAEFIGEMNFLPGVMSDGRFVVAGVGSFAVDGASDDHSAWLGIRPERLSVDGSGDNQLMGRVLDVAFYGAMTHCAVAVDGLAEPVRASLGGPRAIERDAPVRLGWDVADAVLLQP